MLGISGEAGIGKTTLIDRFVHRHRKAVQTVRCAAEYHTNVAPLRPLALVAEQLLGLGATVPPAERRSRIAASLARLALDVELHETPLLDLLGFKDLPDRWRVLAPLLRHDLIAAAIVQLLLAHSHRRCLVVVLEDLQRADSATIELIDRLAKPIEGHPLLVIVAFRPELSRPWARNLSYRELRLQRLSDGDTATLARHLLGGAVPLRLGQRLLAWSKGNPMFLRESLRAAVDAGALQDPDVNITVPASISAVIAARIDRLAPPAKRVLLAASVLGKTFSRDVLADVCGFDAAAMAPEFDCAGHAYLTRTSAECVELCGDAQRLADKAADAQLKIAPVLYAAQARYGLGQYRRAVAELVRDPLLLERRVGRLCGRTACAAMVHARLLAVDCAGRTRPLCHRARADRRLAGTG